MTKFAGYSEEEILPVFDLLIRYLEAPVAHEALFKKYASKKFLKGKLYYHLRCSCTNKRQRRFWLGNGQRTTVLVAEVLATLHNSLSICQPRG